MNIKLSHCSMDLWGESSKIVDLNKPNAAGLSPSGIGLYLGADHLIAGGRVWFFFLTKLFFYFQQKTKLFFFSLIKSKQFFPRGGRDKPFFQDIIARIVNCTLFFMFI